MEKEDNTINTIEINGKTLTLSEDQVRALGKVMEALKEGHEAVLVGAAGTGKTTVLKALLNQWGRNVLFLAPTGKAAIRVTEQSKRKCRTVHSAIFAECTESEDERGKEELHFGEPRPPEECSRGTLVVIDESSMIDEELARHLREQVIGIVGAKILWVGDHEQLPPVGGKWGADLQNPTARLTQVHRQALESPILSLATDIRQGNGDMFKNWGQVQVGEEKHSALRVNKMKVSHAVEWLLSEQGDRCLITFTNNVRKVANMTYRHKKGWEFGTLNVGETLLCMMNNHKLGIMNGEQLVIEEIEELEDYSKALESTVLLVKVNRRMGTQEFVVFPQIFDQDSKEKSDNKLLQEIRRKLYDEGEYEGMRKRAGWDSHDIMAAVQFLRGKVLQCTYGYCLTVHKSQGSQWDEVGFISCGIFRKMSGRDPDFKKRLWYTAVTRAARTYIEFEAGWVEKPDRVRAKLERQKPKEPVAGFSFSLDEPSPESTVTTYTVTPEQGAPCNLSEESHNPNAPIPFDRVHEIFTETGGVITIVGRENSFSYAIEKKEGEKYFFSFVNVLASSDDSIEGRQYIGVMNKFGFRLTGGSKLDKDHSAVKAFHWAEKVIQSKAPVAQKIEVWESIPCTLCGRGLLNPISIAKGIGPYCEKKASS